MLIQLHSQATTTPKIRAKIQASDEPAWVLAERFGTTEQTVWKWRKRDSVQDRSHTAHRLQTTLTPAQEAVAVSLRKTLLVSLDDLLAVVREFLNPDVSRSGLDRCLRRHGVGNLRDLKVKDARPKHSGFKAYEPGYIHIDVKYLPQMEDQTSRRYLFVAIDRATRWVFIRIYNNKTAANARRFLRDLERACPIRIRTILTDNGKEFTDRLFGLRKRIATGKHEFDRLCTELNIEHRLTPPRSPQTNGMVERFNGRIEDVLQSHHFRSGEELDATLHRYVWLYNQQLPQSALGSKTPGLAACQKGLPVAFVTAAALVNELMESRDEKRLLRLQRQLAKVKLLIIDELGFVPLSKTGAELLFELISQRYERGSTLITSNLPFEEWTDTFGTERLTGALLDRLTHHVNILEMNGESYRLSQSRQRTKTTGT